ncbi:MAG: response regulator [Methylobacter sp.]|nr:MAG: response regulator [Methylobacter sp.]
MQKGKQVNVLIVEDNLFIQMLYSELMSNWGYDFDMASNGIEAVEFAQKNNGKYDFCLMDVEMPKMNGIEATKIIRKTTTYFPIMAYTANKEYKKACFEAGMDDFALKPYLPDDLLSKINELLARRPE